MPYNSNEKDKLKMIISKILTGKYILRSDEEILELIKKLLHEKDVDEKKIFEKQVELINKLKLFKEKSLEKIIDKNNEIYELKVQLGEKKSEWKIRGNAASRWNPDNLKFEPCILPLNFNINKMYITSVDEIGGKMWYDYPNDTEKPKQKQYWMYTEFYDFYDSQLISKKNKIIKIQPINISSKEELKKYLEELLVEEIDSYPLLDIFIDFLFDCILEKKKKHFKRKDVVLYCEKKLDKINPGTVTKYLNMLVEKNVLYKYRQGIYRLNIK